MQNESKEMKRKAVTDLVTRVKRLIRSNPLFSDQSVFLRRVVLANA